HRGASAGETTRSPALVPAGTAVRRVSGGWAWCARPWSCGGRREAELGAIAPHAMEHDSKLARDGHQRLAATDPLGERAAPHRQRLGRAERRSRTLAAS